MSSKKTFSGLIILAVIASFLFFTIQLAASKIITPIFGGTSWVWVLTMLFFQTVLLLGYVLATLIRKYSVRRTLLILGVLIGISSFLVISPEQWGVKLSSYDMFQVLYLLTASFGFSGVLLSLTTIILQKTAFSSDISPWQLYFYSNIGSMAGIILYPLIIENLFSLSVFLGLWKILLIIVGLMMMANSFFIDKTVFFSNTKNFVDIEKPSLTTISLWTLFSFIPSAFLAVISVFLLQDIASMPFLWALPLAVFMFAFSLPFAPRKITVENHSFIYLVTGILLILTTYIFMIKNRNIVISVGISLFAVFCVTWVMVSGLINNKPKEEYLEYFYITIAAGGFLGNFFVSVISPIIFDDYYERWIIIGLIFILISIAALTVDKKINLFNRSKGTIVNFIIINLIILLFVGIRIYNKDIFEYKYSEGEKIDIARSMYGVVSVRDKYMKDEYSREYKLRFLYNGTIFHGYQVILDGELNTNKLVEYYDMNTPLPELYRKVWKKAQYDGTQDVAVIGLGIGAVNFYSIPGITTTFYEIDKNVVEMGQKHFSFLKMHDRDYNIKIGDGRFLLNKEPDNKYAMIIVDAFTGVSVPRHLLTSEAIELYLRKMKDDGVLIIHTSNKYLEVDKILNLSIYSIKGLYCYYFDNGYAEFVIASKMPLTDMKDNVVIYEKENILSGKTWTDDYTPIFPFIK